MDPGSTSVTCTTSSASPGPTAAPLPAPVAQQSSYTVTQNSHVVIPWTDAATANLGALTWNSGSLPSEFSNMHFAQASTTAPHTNSLIFDVNSNAPLVNVFFPVSVQSATSGVKSPDADIIISVQAATSTPSPAPTRNPPPAPVAAKSSYTADRTAHVVIPLSENAATYNGTLTWNATGAPKWFSNVHFSQNQTADSASNSLIFDVAIDTVPATYPLGISVKNASGLSSVVSKITVTVPHIVGFYTIINSDNIYETDANRNVIVSDGSQYVSSGPTIVADFQGTITDINVASNYRKTQSISNLPSWFNANEVDAQCIGEGYPIGADDGKTPLTMNFSVECVRAQVNSMDLTSISSVVNNYDQILPNLPKQNVPCTNPSVSGLVFTCSAKNVVISTYTSQATTIQLNMSLNYIGDTADAQTAPGYFIVNAKGASYPKQIFTGGNGEAVPFPEITSPLTYCPNGTPNSATCPTSNTISLRKATILYYPTRGWLVPNGVTDNSSGGLQTHHILPSACGGGNGSGNGIFLTSTQHNPFTQWWRYVPPCAPMGPTD